MRPLLFALLALGCTGEAGDPHALMCLVAFDDTRAGLVIEAADEWHDRTGGRVALRFEARAREVECSEDSITLILVKDLRGADGQAALGATSSFKTWIQFEADDRWLWTFPTTARHELGHYLTDDALQHSADPRDIMFPSWTPQQDGHLTRRDVARFEYAQ
jgi:hypothetical protein